MRQATRRPIGSFLSDAPPPAAPLAPVGPPSDISTVRAAIYSARPLWLTVDAVAAATGISREKVRSAVALLLRAEAIDRRLPAELARFNSRRRGAAQQSYRWREGVQP